MSLFGQSSGTNAGGGSLFGGLSLTTTGGGVDAQGKRKSIFDASTSQSNNPQPQQSSNLFGGPAAANTAPSSGASLFGQTTNTTSGSSLFGNTTTSAPSAGGLFGTTTAISVPSGGGLFGSAAAKPAPSGGGLFGSTMTTSAPSGGGLFGNTTTTTAPSGGGLFGTAANTNAPSGGGLFGSTSTTSAPSGGGLFGTAASTAAPSNPLGGASLFGARASTNQNNATSTFGQTQASQAGPSGDQQNAGLKQTRDGAYFNSLLERQKKKARLQPTDGNFRRSQLPNLNMDLGDLARRAQELGGRGSGPDVADSRAHYLLAGSGVAPGRSFRGFKGDDDVMPEGPPTMPDHAFETESYIRNLQAKGREAVMRENMERVYREVDAYIEQTLGIDFEDQKQRIMKHFGLISDEDEARATGQTSTGPGTTRGPGLTGTSQPARSVFGRSALNRSIIGPAGSVNGTPSFFKSSAAPVKGGSLLRGQSARDLRDKERLFVEQVELLNQARMPPREKAPYPIMEKFGEVEANAGGDSPSQLADAYKALREITKESSSSPVPERHFAAAYAHTTNPGTPEDLRRQILEGSRSHLEKVFFREVERLIAEDPRTAQVGGQPTVINKIRAYIRVRASRRDLAPDGAELQQIGENGDYCWILIFYLIRAGFIKEAAQYVQQDTAFQSTDKRFVGYMSNYSNSPDRRLPKNLQSMIDGEYQQRARLAPKGSVDPYRMACYKIVGRCDTESRNLDGIGQGVEDWLWLQFALARDPPRDEESGQPFGLEQIQETVNEIGEKHFQRSQADSSTGYGTYFLMQILSGMFEQAVDYLHTFNPVSAVHFAIALSYYGLLRTVSDFNTAGNELLYRSTTDQAQINFVPLIAYHTATFRVALPVAAVDYLCLICLNSDQKPASQGQNQTRACHECLRELCLETREFAILLGDVRRSDGARIPGAIEQRRPLIKFESRDEFLRSITTQSAAIADQRGQVADAVLLYHLCEEYDNVVVVLNRALADAVTLDLGDTPMELQPLKGRREHQSPSNASLASSTSLIQSTTSPVELAKIMAALYNREESYFGKISNVNREVCGGLLKLAAIRGHLESDPPKYMPALQELNELGVLPLEARGAIPVIRAAASSFGSMPPLLARCIGIAIVWAVKAIGGERDRIARQGSWDAGYYNDGDSIKEQLSSMAKDLMVFAGLVKYKLPARVYDMLTRAGGDVGAY